MTKLTKEEWIKRLMDAGIPTEDVADTIYMAYTDDGECDRTPEEVAKIEIDIHPSFKLYPKK